MDTGAILLQRASPIGPDETAGELATRLAELGAHVLVETLACLPGLTPVPQDDAAATRACRLTKETGGRLTRPAGELAARVRGASTSGPAPPRPRRWAGSSSGGRRAVPGPGSRAS
jgi:methionyl-tRNA formyltransferase